MRRTILLCMGICLAVATAGADPNDLEGGVFIAHYPAAMEFSSDPPPEGWCQHYLDNYAITSCEEQKNRIDTGDGVIWYVLAAWQEEKDWSGAELGFSEYPDSLFTFTDWGPCFPSQGLEVPTDSWPGPNEGIAIAATDVMWQGNFTPLYYFAGYAYAAGQLPLGVDPPTQFAGTVGVGEPPQSWPAHDLGALGLFTEGRYVCPSSVGHEVVSMFRPDVVRFAEGASQGSVEDANISSAPVESLLIAHGVQMLARTFHGTPYSDTTLVSRTGEEVRLPDLSNIYTLTLPDSTERDSLLAAVSGILDVVFADPNDYFFPGRSRTPPVNDPLYTLQWHLNDDVNDWDINAPEAWLTTTGGEEVRLAVLDSGVDRNHEEFAPRAIGSSTWQSSPGSSWYDHGFGVAGVAAANTDNAFAIAGVDRRCTIITRRVDILSLPLIANVVVSVIEEDDAEILNCSWSNQNHNDITHIAFATAYKLNAICVSSMGNRNSSDPEYPAAFKHEVIAVGATTSEGWRWVLDGSNGSNIGDHIDVSAPGKNICTVSQESPGYYQVGTGTSFAAPCVSGIAALLLGERPGLYNDDIAQILRISAEHPEQLEWDEEFGTGIVRAEAALALLHPPHRLQQVTVQDGYDTIDVSDWTQYYFIGIPGLPEGYYRVRRAKLEKDVEFPHSFSEAPHVWARGAAMTDGGWSAAWKNYGIGWCLPLEGTVTIEGCRLRTFVYDVTTYPSGSPLGWFPCAPEDVKFAYTVLGIPSGTVVREESLGMPAAPLVEISGPTMIHGNVEVTLALREGTCVDVAVFDVGGRKVQEYEYGRLGVGKHRLSWDGTASSGERAGTGIYLLRVMTASGVQTRRVLIVR